VVGYKLGEAFPPAVTELFTPLYEKALCGEICSFELPFAQFCYHEQVVPIRDDDGTINSGMVIARNITEQKQAENGLISAKKQAEEANLAKSQFLANMSHELRTPLNPIIGFADLLALAPNLSEEQKKWLEIISQRGCDLSLLIGDILDLCKIESQKIVMNHHPMNLQAMLHDMVSSMQPSAVKKQLQLEYVIAPNVAQYILADGHKLRQVILNLLTNAIKYTQTGSITLSVESNSSNKIKRTLSAGETSLLFSVTDTGIGIAAEKQSIIFEAFKQADISQAAEYGGAGLGLAIAQGLVTLMDGEIWVESAPGQGSTFHFSIIVQEQHQELTKENQSESTALLIHNSIKSLVVDDDINSAFLLESVLKQKGQIVRLAHNGDDALAMISGDSFDLVFMDIRMPGMNGVDVTKAIRALDLQRKKHTPIIAVTAHALAGDKQGFLEAGMDAYITKPIRRQALFRVINEILSSAHESKS